MRGSANIKVRPLRLALLVDPNSALQIRGAIRLACSLWGGMFFPIIPMYKRMPASWHDKPLRTPSAKDVVQGYIDAFDPDILVQFSAELPSYIADARLEVVKPQDVWNNAAHGADGDPSFGISVLDVMNDVYRECFKYKQKYPTKVIIPTMPKKLGLFWASVFGEYSSEILSVVDDHYSEPLEIDRPQVAADKFHTFTDTDTLFPRRITSWGLSQGRLGFGRNACVYFMDAASAEDIIDYWNLRATGRSVVPLPKQFLHEESFKKTTKEFLIQERRAWRHDPKNFDAASFVRSRHSTMDEMAQFAKTLEFSESNSNDPANPNYLLQHWYPRIWDEWARGKDGGVADIYADGEDSIEIESAPDLEMRLKPLFPKFTQSSRVGSHGICANEFDLHLFGANEHLAEVYPKVHGANLARAISGIGFRGEWRIGRHGLVKLVRNSVVESRTVPASETIFFAWLADHGWKAELSPPGILAKQIFKRLNGYPRLLSDKSVLGLIEYMNGGSVKKNGEPSAENRVSTERELAVGEIKKRLAGQSGLSGLYDTFLQKGVFKLGLRTKCPACQRNTWFGLSSLRESMDCPKCLSAFPAAGNIDQKSGSWYYRTAGPFSVPNYADGAYAVLLTLDALSDRMFSLIRTTAVPSFSAASTGKDALEADLAMFWRDVSYGEESEGLLFGECKTYGLFEAKDISRMSYLASTFPGAVLVFSTLREAFTTKEVAALRRLAKSGRKYWKTERPINPVLILTGTELLNWQRPPYCWDKAQQERFRHVHDILSLCDATQQLYLNLPPWSDDWRKRWERKIHRRKAQ